jgi:hypothetical protein
MLEVASSVEEELVAADNPATEKTRLGFRG